MYHIWKWWKVDYGMLKHRGSLSDACTGTCTTYHTSSTPGDIERWRAHLGIHQHTISSIQLYHNSNKLLCMLSFYTVSDLIKLMLQTRGAVYTATRVHMYFNHKQLTRSLFKIMNFFNIKEWTWMYINFNIVKTKQPDTERMGTHPILWSLWPDSDTQVNIHRYIALYFTCFRINTDHLSLLSL